MTRQWVSIPNPLANPLLTNMSRIVETFEFPCNPPFRIWMRVLPTAAFQTFWSVIQPTPKQIIKKVLGHSWLCETKQVLKAGIPAEVGFLADIGEVAYVSIEVAEGVAFWYWVVQETIDFIILWSTLARRASVCGGYGWMDATRIDFAIPDTGEWYVLGWAAWTTGGTQVFMNGTVCTVPNGASYSSSFQCQGQRHEPTEAASFELMLITESGVPIAQSNVRTTDPDTNQMGGDFTSFAFRGEGTTGLMVAARTTKGTGDVFFTKGNWVVSATLNMRVPT
jgi:hypothetical protein